MKTAERQTILLVEDEAVVAMDEARRLSQRGFTVQTVHNGEEAVSRAAEDREIDLVLMDIDLGSGIDGTEAARQILQQRELPVIFLTSHAEEEMVERAKEITNYGYVLKSSGEFVLLESIKMAFQLFEAHRRERQEKENLQATLHSIGEAVISTDAEGRVTRFNHAAADLTGVMAEDALGCPLEEVLHVVHGEDGSAISLPLEQVLQQGTTVSLPADTLLLSRDGSSFRIADTSAPIHSRSGEIVGTITVFRDVSRSHRLEEELRESNRFLATLLHNLPGMAYRCRNDPDYTMVFVSNGARSLTGYGPDALLYNRTVSYGSLVVSEDRAYVWESVQQALRKQESFTVIYRIRRKDGQTRWVWEQGTGVYDSNGEFAGLEGFITDVSEQKQAEREQQRLLEEQRILLREVHHRTKNDMNALRSLLSLQADASEYAGEREALEEAQRRISVMGRIYEALHAGQNVSRLQAGPFLRELLDDITSSRAESDRIRLETEIEEIDVPAKLSFPLGIVVNELLTNAWSYAFKGLDGGVIRVTLRRRDDQLIELLVADNGIGPPLEVAEGSSLGFGLSVVDSLCRQYGGQLQIREDRGTTVQVLLPVNGRTA